jgi:hypothetical protein
MPKDKFADLVRKVVRACPSLQASNIGAAILADAQQVVQFFYLQHVVNLGIIQTFCQEHHSGSDAVLPEHSPDDLEQQEDDLNQTVCENSASEPGTKKVNYPWGSVSSLLMSHDPQGRRDHLSS